MSITTFLIECINVCSEEVLVCLVFILHFRYWISECASNLSFLQEKKAMIKPSKVISIFNKDFIL